MKLADMMGGNTCSDIVPGRTNMDMEKTRQQEQEKLEQRIKEESGEVKKRKATPIEYLLLFGKVPRLDQVQVMKPENLNREDAKRFLDAGCSKCHLMRLYGIQNPGGPHYKQLAEILREQQPASKKLNIIWIAPPVINAPKIRINKHSLVFINKLAVESAPNKYHQGFKARIGIDETQKILVVQPSEEGEYVFRKYRTAIVMTSRALGRQIQKRGIALPAEFAAPWDKDLQAWMGQLIRKESPTSTCGGVWKDNLLK